MAPHHERNHAASFSFGIGLPASLGARLDRRRRQVPARRPQRARAGERRVTAFSRVALDSLDDRHRFHATCAGGCPGEQLRVGGPAVGGEPGPGLVTKRIAQRHQPERRVPRHDIADTGNAGTLAEQTRCPRAHPTLPLVGFAFERRSLPRSHRRRCRCAGETPAAWPGRPQSPRGGESRHHACADRIAGAPP